jgi:glycosyltransferase involved in cell wall biosynthesis
LLDPQRKKIRTIQRMDATRLKTREAPETAVELDKIDRQDPAASVRTAKPSGLRVLYLHQYFQTPQCSGGIRSYEFARRMIAAGHQVTIITSTAGLQEPYRSATKHQRMELDGIPIIAIAQPYNNSMTYRQRIRAFLGFAFAASVAAVRQRADVIFATSTPLTIAIPAILAHFWHRKPMVFEVRDLWPELPIALGALKNPILQWLAQGLEWAAYHSSEHVVALSPGMADGVIRRGMPAGRVTVIPNSCDLELFDVPPERGQGFRERLGLTKTQPLIVYCGTFGLVNGVGYLVDVAAAMRSINPEVQFLLLGSGAERTQVLDKARRAGVLDQNLRVMNPIPKTETAAVLSAATVATSVVVPVKALEHNSANKFFDALAAGTPIAINHGGWQADLLRESGAGIVLPYHAPDEAAQLLADFIQDSTRLEAAGEAARNLARTRFARDDLYEKLDRILTEAAGQTDKGSNWRADSTVA